jgi:RNA polymerase sigma factor (sigma-70 family)
MHDEQDRFRQVMRRVREGSQEAAQELFDVYGPHIRRIVRRNLHKRLRPKFDSCDFVQAVWATFFADKRLGNFESPQALVAFLATVARNKVVEVTRQRLQTQKYDLDRERSLDGSAAWCMNAVPARQPTPSQVAVAKEQWELLLDKLPAHQRDILVMVRQGSTNQEIADLLGINEKTVRRVLTRLALRTRVHEEPAKTSSCSLPGADA